MLDADHVLPFQFRMLPRSPVVGPTTAHTSFGALPQTPYREAVVGLLTEHQPSTLQSGAPPSPASEPASDVTPPEEELPASPSEPEELEVELEPEEELVELDNELLELDEAPPSAPASVSTKSTLQLTSPSKTSVHGFWVQGQLALPSS